MKTFTLKFLFFLVIFISNTSAQTSNSANAEKINWQSIACFGSPFTCKAITATGFLFSKPQQTKIVLISHGSQGIDSRMYDYVDSLQKEGFAALVIDHWTPRNISVTHEDYVAAGKKGGNEFNMSADSLTAAAWLRARGFKRIGSIGESQGGAAAIMLQQKFAHTLIEKNVRRIYDSLIELKPIDAVVSMYGYCGYRNALRDAYVGTPFLFITGEKDNETPSRYCERHVGWMNDRGGNTKIVVLTDEGHSFDAPYRRRYVVGPHYANCDVLVDTSGVTELNSGIKMLGTDPNPMMAKCVSKGFHTGYWTDRFIAVPYWIAFFNRHL